MEVDVTGLPRGGTRYSSTNSLNNATTASSPQALQSTSITSNIQHPHTANTGVVCQTQDLNLARNSRESPPAITSTTPASSIPLPTQVSSSLYLFLFKLSDILSILALYGQIARLQLLRFCNKTMRKQTYAFAEPLTNFY